MVETYSSERKGMKENQECANGDYLDITSQKPELPKTQFHLFHVKQVPKVLHQQPHQSCCNVEGVSVKTRSNYIILTISCFVGGAMTTSFLVLIAVTFLVGIEEVRNLFYSLKQIATSLIVFRLIHLIQFLSGNGQFQSTDACQGPILLSLTTYV